MNNWRLQCEVSIHSHQFVMNKITLSLLYKGILNAIYLPSIIEAVIPASEFDISFDPDQEDFDYEAAREQTRYAVALDDLGIEQHVIGEIVRNLDFGRITGRSRSLDFSDIEEFELVLE